VSEISFGRVLKELRLHVGLTQQELAQRADLSAATIAKLEQAKDSSNASEPRSKTMQKICGGLGISSSILAEIRGKVTSDRDLNRLKEIATSAGVIKNAALMPIGGLLSPLLATSGLGLTSLLKTISRSSGKDRIEDLDDLALELLSAEIALRLKHEFEQLRQTEAEQASL